VGRSSPGPCAFAEYLIQINARGLPPRDCLRFSDPVVSPLVFFVPVFLQWPFPRVPAIPSRFQEPPSLLFSSRCCCEISFPSMLVLCFLLCAFRVFVHVLFPSVCVCANCLRHKSVFVFDCTVLWVCAFSAFFVCYIGRLPPRLFSYMLAFCSEYFRCTNILFSCF